MLSLILWKRVTNAFGSQALPRPAGGEGPDSSLHKKRTPSLSTLLASIIGPSSQIFAPR